MMNKTVIVLIGGALLLIIGFVYLQSKPAPQAPNVKQIESVNTGNPSPSPTMKPAKQYQNPPEMKIDPKKSYVATMKTSKGALKINLFAEDTPVTVNNFVFLTKDGFYDGTTFHRIISGFMVQGGDPQGDGTGGPGYKFADEPITRDYKRGILAMANAGPDTNGSQFFIVHKDTQLPKNYVIFGELADDDSLKTLDAIAATQVTDNPVTGERGSMPVEQVTIETVVIGEK